MGLDDLTLSDMLSLKRNALSAISRTVAGLPQEKAGAHPSPGAWSVAEILEHLVLVETQMVPLVGSLLAKTEHSRRPGTAAHAQPLSVEAIHERSLSERYKTKGRYEPAGTVAPASSLEQLHGLQTQLLALEPRLRLIDLGFASFPHWEFGPLTLGQWLVFVALHEERHLGQIRATLGPPALS